MTKKEIQLMDLDELMDRLFMDQEFVREYLSLNIREGDMTEIKECLRRVAKVQGGMTYTAKKMKTTRQALHAKLSVRGQPAFGSIVEILRVLGYQLDVKPFKAVGR